jgi:anti-sigma B factor antagonist
MDVTAELQGAATIVHVVGSLDALTAPALTEFFSGQLQAERARLIADLSGLEYSSSAGLRVLLAAVKEARQRGGDLRLAGVTPQVSKVLNMSGFNNILKIFPDVPAAVASFGA